MKLSEVKDYTLGVLRGAFKNKNILDDISAEGKNLRYKGNNLGDSYLFTGAESYAEDEQIIGKWINGKPLYRKVINTGTLPNTTTKTINHGIDNLEHAVNIYGYAHRTSDKTSFPLPFVYQSDIKNQINIIIRDTYIQIQTGNDRSNLTISYIVLEYTKTTDAPGADVDTGNQPMNFIDGGTYSTDEVIVGQWIDGKPLYRLVYDLPNVTKSGWFSTGIKAPKDMEYLTKMTGISIDSVFQGPAYWIQSSDTLRVGYNDGELYLNIGSNYPRKPCHVIVIAEYTKTTDEPQDMSITSTLTTTATDEEVAEVFA